MKRLLFIFALLVVLISCEKEEEESYCWQCNREVWYNNVYMSNVFQVCGMTYEERASFEIANTNTSNGVKTTTTCKLSK